MNKKVPIKLLQKLLKEIESGHIDDDILVALLPRIKKQRGRDGDFITDKTVFEFDFSVSKNVIPLLLDWFIQNLQSRKLNDTKFQVDEENNSISFSYREHNDYIEEPDYIISLKANHEDGTTKVNLRFETIVYDLDEAFG